MTLPIVLHYGSISQTILLFKDRNFRRLKREEKESLMKWERIALPSLLYQLWNPNWFWCKLESSPSLNTIFRKCCVCSILKHLLVTWECVSGTYGRERGGEKRKRERKDEREGERLRDICWCSKKRRSQDSSRGKRYISENRERERGGGEEIGKDDRAMCKRWNRKEGEK